MIVPVKKASIAILKENYDDVIKSLQKSSVIMIIDGEAHDRKTSLDLSQSLMADVEQSIKLLKKYEQKKPLFGSYLETDLEEFLNVNYDTTKLPELILSLSKEIEELDLKIKDQISYLKKLSKWENLDIIPSELKNTKYTKIIVVEVLNREVEKLEKLFVENNYIYNFYGSDERTTALVVSSYIDDYDELYTRLQEFGFEEISLPQVDYLLKDYLEKENQEVQNLLALKEEKLNLLKSYVTSLDDLKVLNDQILTQNALDNIMFIATNNTAVINGWVRSDEHDKLVEALEAATSIYELEYVEPNENEIVPTYNKNNKFTSQFETITDMFSKPHSKEVDPNPVMSFWYWILFGMMMGDVGYGILMIIGGIIAKKIMKPKGGTLKLINIILYSGIPTIIWGIIFGSYFGFNLKEDFGLSFVWYAFSPMDNPIMMLLVSIIVGALHLMTGLVVKIYIDIKEKDYIDLFSKNLSWILILSGIGVFFLSKIAGLVLVLIGVLLILVFNGARKKSLIGKMAFGLLGLYDLTSYLSDLLSYSRIMALAMSSAAVAMVMNTLAQMVGGNPVGMIFSALIFMVGHLFNLVLGLLSAYVHDSRLQYIEFFGKFFEGGGVDFKPLSIETKYVKNIKQKNIE